MRISDWSSDVCSSDLWRLPRSILWTLSASDFQTPRATQSGVGAMSVGHVRIGVSGPCQTASPTSIGYVPSPRPEASKSIDARGQRRSEEHTSELQSLMRISYAVFCLYKKIK